MRYGKRSSRQHPHDAAMRPKNPKSAVLTPADEALS